MSKKDWFRKSTWTSEDREDFFAHLKRARKDNKAQYLRIQAGHLKETRDPEAIVAALELLDLMINEWPSSIQLESAHYQKATCLEALGRLDEAVTAYRQSFGARRNMPNVRTDAPLNFGIFAVRHNRTDLYKEVLSVLQEFVTANDIIFPIQEYRYYAAFAIIADYHDRKDVARECAVRALQAVTKTHSGFSYHPKVGLVAKTEQKLDEQLRRICAV